MIAPKNHECPYHTRTVGHGIFRKEEKVEGIELIKSATQDKDGKIKVIMMCPRCKAVFDTD